MDKASLLTLDSATLYEIIDHARYKLACTKSSAGRTKEDLRVLMQRTSVVCVRGGLSEAVHLELCRAMTYRRVQQGTILVRKGMGVNCVLMIISGTLNTYITNPQRSATGSFNRMQASRLGGRNREMSLFMGGSFYADDTPHETLRSGQALGEEELLADTDDPVYGATAVAMSTVELMEIGRAEFERIVKASRTTERGMVVEFLSSLSATAGCAHALRPRRPAQLHRHPLNYLSPPLL